MGRLDVAGQDDPVAGPGDPVAELDVLDRGSAVELGVETAGLEEDVATDQAAAGPEGVRGADVVDERADLMDVMVEEVAEPADEAGGVGLVVVGAEEADEVGVGVEPADGAGDRVAVDGDVGVEEEDQRGGRGQGSGVTGRGRAELPGVSEMTVAPKYSATVAEPSVEPSSTTTSS